MSKVRVSNFWRIEAVETRALNVVFYEYLTEEEAIEAYLNGEYEDIIDEEILHVVDVIKANILT